MLKLGLIVNPVAGVGGAVGLKGSDGADTQRRAGELGGSGRAPERVRRALLAMGTTAKSCEWYSWAGAMGGDALAEQQLPATVLGTTPSHPSRNDTIQAALAMRHAGVDLIVFVGGDGTARDLLEAIGQSLPVLGIPAGVKMHSGVFATTPERGGELLARLLTGGLVNAVRRRVQDLDEQALRDGRLYPRHFGELVVPEPGGYLQHTKERGRESEALVVGEICAYVIERLSELDCPVVLGPGSTVAAVKSALGFEGTLVGFDVWQGDAVRALDVNAAWLTTHLERAVIVLSFTRGQGFLLGRGNQQLDPRLLRKLGRRSLWILGTRTKLDSLEGRPLLIDTDDPQLDAEFSGLAEVIAGYEDHLLYRLATHA